MATTELSAIGRRPGGAWALAYAALWAGTLAAAALVALAGHTLTAPVKATLALRLTATSQPRAGRALALAAHNIPIACWPLLLGLGPRRSPRTRAALDALIGACALANTITVGAALGAYGSALIPYIPQLPLEWAGLAGGYGAWLIERARPLRGSERLALLSATVALLALAAASETYAVPHR